MPKRRQSPPPPASSDGVIAIHKAQGPACYYALEQSADCTLDIDSATVFTYVPESHSLKIPGDADGNDYLGLTSNGTYFQFRTSPSAGPSTYTEGAIGTSLFTINPGTVAISLNWAYPNGNTFPLIPEMNSYNNLFATINGAGFYPPDPSSPVGYGPVKLVWVPSSN